MKKSVVALVNCDNYSEDAVYDAVRQGVELLGGMQLFVKPGEKIVVKPNVLVGVVPEKAVTTHPSIFKAVARMLLESGAVVTCGDSPGFGSCESNLRRAGLKSAADELSIEVADFDAGREIVHAEAMRSKRLLVANGVLDSDGLVSVSKLKTHGLLRFTGAIKNQFGCVPGLAKGQFHIKMPDPYDFAAMLVDINSYLRPRLFIMDGIIAMEGNGPRNGKPRKMNVLLFSADPVALDAVACRLIALDTGCVPTLHMGELAGLGTCNYDEIEVLGGSTGQFTAEDFDVVRRPPISNSGGRILSFIKNRTCPRPVIDRARCTRCGICVQVCPVNPKAVDWDTVHKERPPVHNYDRCIRCYCCQELCPEGAVIIRRSMVGDLLLR